jgi:hypothetical protein
MEEKNMTELKIENIGFAEPKGKVEDINRLKNVIRILLKNVSSTKYKTELIKLCFIIDYKYSKEVGGINPTTVKYVRYNYGPYSDCFIEAFNQLINEGIIIEVGLPFGVGYNLLPGEEPAVDTKIKELILKVIKEYGNSPLKAMKEYIYNLPEFKSTQFGQEIILN